MADRSSASPFDKIAADRLAMAVVRLIDIGRLDARSEAGDALLDYLQVGSIGGPRTVHEWSESYRSRIKAKGGAVQGVVFERCTAHDNSGQGKQTGKGGA